jgi:ATP adenylyltransferase
VDRLWAPWRLEYIKSADEESECIFCAAAAGGDDAERLVVHRGEHAILLLNKFPYSSGHFMVAPVRHVGEYGELADKEVLELHRFASAGMGALAETYAPQGYNLGWNLGRIAGAGVVDHVHLHVVPRWAGDTNFMPIIGGARVLSDGLRALYDKLLEAQANMASRR